MANLERPTPSLMTPSASTSKGAKVISEIASKYVKEYVQIEPADRYNFLENVFTRNSEALIDFLALLRASFSSDFSKGLFSLVYEIIINHQIEHEIKTKLFVQSLIFYESEDLEVEPKLLESAMVYLANLPNIDQTLGLAKYVFHTGNQHFAELEAQLIQLDKANIGIIPLMYDTFNKHNIDLQVIQLLPDTLLILNKPFIQTLKTRHGLDLIQHIDSRCTEDFIQICALSSSPDLESL